MVNNSNDIGKSGRRKKILIFAAAVILIVLGILLVLHISKKRQYEAEEAKRAEQAKKETEAAQQEQDEAEKEKVKQSGTPSVLCSSVSGAPGETVSLSVEIINNPGILGSSMTLSFDDSVLTLKKAENGEAFTDVLELSQSKELSSGAVFLWDGETIEEDQIKDGVILNLTFEINKDAPEGKTPVTLVFDQDGTVDNDLNPVDLSVESGAVTVCS